jgi:hypothetical protein
MTRICAQRSPRWEAKLVRWVVLLLTASALVVASCISTSPGTSVDDSRPMPTMLCPPAC